MAKQLAVNLLKGLGISHISLPIRIFEPRSTIQRIVDFWSHTSDMFNKAKNEKDPVERLKWVIAASISSYYLCTNQNKPFNPLLGETHQGSFPDGSRFYCEHTSHHPPISHYLLEGPNEDWRMSGYYEYIGSISGNSLTSGFRGPTTLEFKDGTKIRFHLPDFRISGALYGDRVLEGTGTLCFQDMTNNLKAVILMNTYKEKGMFNKSVTGSKTGFEGVIYKVIAEKNTPIKFGKKQELPDDLKKLKDMEKKLCDISGGFLDEISFSGKQFWNINNDKPLRQIPQTASQAIY